MPSGSLLFPATAPAGRSPMLASSPARHMPFAMGPSATPGYDSLAPAQKQSQNDFSAFSPSALRPNMTPLGRSAMPAPLSTSRAANTAAATDMPPLQSLLDAGGASSCVGTPARARNAAPEAAAPAEPTTPAVGAGASTPAPPTGLMSGRATDSVRDRSGGLWVTVFGYQSNAMLGAVLDELRPSGGELVQHRMGVGMWVHLQFRDWRQQQQALAKNGKVRPSPCTPSSPSPSPDRTPCHPACRARPFQPLSLRAAFGRSSKDRCLALSRASCRLPRCSTCRRAQWEWACPSGCSIDPPPSGLPFARRRSSPVTSGVPAGSHASASTCSDGEPLRAPVRMVRRGARPTRPCGGWRRGRRGAAERPGAGSTHSPATRGSARVLR